MQNRNNFRLLLLSSSIVAFTIGIYGPFWVLYINRVGGSLENFGYALGLNVLAYSLTSYFAGKHSDTIGRKPLILFSLIFGAFLMVCYVFISSPLQLFALQTVYGANDSILGIGENALLADLTKRKTRGLQMGKYKAIIGMLQGIAMFIGGALTSVLGLEFIFYASAAFSVVAAIPIYFIKER